MSKRWQSWFWLAVAILGLLLSGLTLWGLLWGGVDIDALWLTAVPRDMTVLEPITAPPGGGRVAGLLVTLPVPLAIGLLSWVGLIAWSIAAIWIAFMMYRLFAELDSEGVFNARNASRLRRTGWLLILAEALRIAATMIQDIYVRRMLGEDPWMFGTASDRDVHLIFGGLVLLGLARAFRIGIRLRQDAELTI